MIWRRSWASIIRSFRSIRVVFDGCIVASSRAPAITQVAQFSVSAALQFGSAVRARLFRGWIAALYGCAGSAADRSSSWRRRDPVADRNEDNATGVEALRASDPMMARLIGRPSRDG